MARSHQIAFGCLAILAAIQGAVPSPGSFSYSGTFSSDDEAREFFFSLSAPAAVTLRTFSYAGGMNAAGAIIPRGGFDPTISLFDAGGATVAMNRDGGCDRVARDAVTSSCWDAALTAALPAGNYRVVLTQSDNAPSGAALTDSFLFSRQGNFTQPPGNAAAGFWDYYPDKRTGFYALDIQGVSSSQAPASISSTTAPRAITGLPYAPYPLSVPGAPGSNFTWSDLSALPPGISLSSAGVLQGTPTATGAFTFTAQASDGVQTVQQTVTLIVYDPLTITTALLPAATSGQAYGPIALAAIGGSGTYIWSAANLPPGLTLSSNGQLSGTPSAIGVFAMIVTVSDATSAQTVTKIVSLTVTALPTPALSITSSGSLPGIALGAAVNAVFTATGGMPSYTWSASGLPPGVVINAATGALSGVPGAPGIYSFFVRVADAQTDTASVAVTLPVLGFVTHNLPGATAGVPYLALLAAVGGAPPFTYSATGIPAGLTLSAAGMLSGTASNPGNYSVVFTARDSAGVSASLNLTLPIANAIVPGQADLVLSETALSFPIVAGASGLPDPASVTVRSSAVEQLLNYAVTTDAPWLNVTGGGTTPGSIGVALNGSAANLASAAAPYTASVTVRCSAPGTCAGSTQTVTVSLRVSAPPPQLALSDELLSFVSTPGSPARTSQTVAIRNTGGGTLQIQSLVAADSWLSFSASPTSVASGTEGLLTVTADASGFAPGYRRGSITVVSSAGQATVYVGLLVASAPAMSLLPGAMQFELPAGGALGRVDGSFEIGIAGVGAVDWSAAAIGAAWLRVTTATGTASAASAGRVIFAIDRAAAANLPMGTYHGTVRVQSPGVVDSPLDFRVVLTVTPVSAPLAPDPSPDGLVFLSAGPGAVQQKTVPLRVSSTLPAAYQASASANAAAWLSVSPALGTASALAPAQSVVSVNAAGLPSGVYRSGISYAFAGGPVRTVSVTLIVTAGPSCVPAQAVLAQVVLLNNFALRARLPAPLSVSVTDNCGNPLNRAQVSISFSNGDAPLNLTAADSGSGTLSGAWTPTGVSPQVTVTATAVAAGLVSGSVSTTGAVTANEGPMVTRNGVLHIYNPAIGGPVAPGAILQIYGVDLAAGDTSVEIAGIRAPIYYVSPGQVNVQAPFELMPGNEVQVVINSGGALSSPVSVKVADAVPGIAAYADGSVIAQHADYSLVSQASPAKIGETILLYLAGLGVTDQAVPTGSASPSDPLARPVTAGSLTLNGVAAATQFVGLTPGSVGLYQVNFTVPSGTPEGVATLVFTQGGWRSNTVKLPVVR